METQVTQSCSLSVSRGWLYFVPGLYQVHYLPKSCILELGLVPNSQSAAKDQDTQKKGRDATPSHTAITTSSVYTLPSD